jgi:hypothetical protein
MVVDDEFWKFLGAPADPDSLAGAVQSGCAVLTAGGDYYRFSCEVRPDGATHLELAEWLKQCTVDECPAFEAVGDPRKWECLLPGVPADRADPGETAAIDRGLALAQARTLLAEVQAELLRAV